MVPYSDLPTHSVTVETSQPAESTSNVAITVPQKRIRDISAPELNDTPTQEFGSSQQKKRKKNRKGEKTVM